MINSSTDSVELGGGTYAGIVDQRNTSESSENRPLSAILADGCAARGPDGLIRCDTADQELAGPITVEKCQYTDIPVQESGDGKHGLLCPYCGYRYEHPTTLTAAADGNIVTLSGGCKDCDYKAALATASFTLPKVTYGQPGEVACTWDAPAGYYVMVWIDNGQSAQSELPEWSWSLEEFFGSTKVTAGRHVLKVSFFNDSSVKPSNVCELDFTIDPAPLTADMVTLDKTEVPYNGQEQKPVITVLQGNGTELEEGTDYEVSCTRGGEVTTDFTNAGTVTVTITGVDNGNYTGTVTKEYTISKADVPESALTCTPPADPFYTGQPKTAVVTADNLTGIGEITVKYKKDNAGSLLAEAKEPGTFHVYAVITGGTNYKEAEIEMDSFTISYMDVPKLLYNKNSAQKDYYSGDVTVTAVPADNHTYTVSDATDGGYEESFTISARQGNVTETLYFKDEAGHISDGVPVTVNFDLTPPTGEIAVGAKWWQNFLHFVSFGHYTAKEYTVSIKAKDAGGSGIDNDRTEYVIVTGSGQYTDKDELAAAALSWMAYDDSARPAVPVNSSSYVVYARLTDKAGNVTYISTDGILLDSSAPTVGGITVPEKTIKDVTANVTFTVDEAADYYYVVLPKDSAAPSAEDIILTCGGTLPEGRTGAAITGTVPKGSGAVSGDTLPAGVSVDVKNLSPGTPYIVYVTAVDRALDIEKEKNGVPAGNITKVTEETKAAFATKKTLPVITKSPTVTGTYGQSLGEMTVAGGAAQGGNTVLTGTWTVGGTDIDRKPDAGTTEKVTVVFTPVNASYDSISIEVSLKVVPRNLNAAGVTVSEAAGTYTYDNGAEIRPAVAVNAGTPTSGIFIFDNEAELTADDLTVSYNHNRNAGIASATITGKGNYTGSVTKGFTIEKASGREVPDLGGNMTVDNETETYTYTITSTEGAVYRMGDDGEWTAPGETAGNVFEGIAPGTRVTFYAKMPETENYKEGTAKNIAVDFPKLTPAAPALSYTRETDETTGEITLIIAEATGAQYSFDGGVNWQDAREKGGFDTSQTVTLAIRLKETGTHNPSPAQTVTVNLAKEDRKAPPAFTLSVAANGETDYTVTIPAAEGCEYSFDGETWSDVNRKTGVRVGETVTGYKRYQETDDYNAGSAVSAKATMPKFTVKTPVISPAGGSYSGSISVTITCGSPGAEIYYTMDGSMPGRSSTRYTGAFTVMAPATVKAAAIKGGLNDSAVAAVSYTKQDDGPGEGSGDNNGNTPAGDHSGGRAPGDSGPGNDGNQGSGQNNGEGSEQDESEGSEQDESEVSGQNNSAANGQNGSQGGNMAPVIQAAPSAANMKPGTESVRPGNGNTGWPETGPGIPFLKGKDDKTGWDVIRAEEEQAGEGSIINVDMNGTTVVPGDIFDSIKGKDITITFDMGNGILWSVDGKSITRDIFRDSAGDIDFSVKTGTDAIPADIVDSCFADNAAGGRYSIQLSLAHEGEFGFTAVLFINCGKENAGYTASLYYYKESTRELEFICSDEVAEDGTVSFAFTHASDYVIAIEGDEEEESGTMEALKNDDESTTADIADTGLKDDLWNRIWVVVVCVGLVIAGMGIFLVGRKKNSKD